MKLAGKLTILTLAVATVPLAIAGLSLGRVSRAALSAQLAEDQAELARSVAARLGDNLSALRRELEHAPSLLPPGDSSDDLLIGMLRVVYHSRDEISAVWLLDGAGRERVPAQHVPEPSLSRGLGQHQAASVDEVARRRAAVPWQAALSGGAALELAREPEGGAHLVLAVAIVLDTRGGPEPHVIAVDLALTQTGLLLAESAGPPGRALALVDAGGQLASGRFAGSPGARVLRAEAPVPGGPLLVVATALPSVAYARASDLDARMWYWLAVATLAAVVCAVVFARGVSARVRALAARCTAIARGDWKGSGRAIRSADELGELSRTIDKMAADLDAKRTEITAWTRELEQRVADKTAELAQAQEQILRSRSLAAIGTLGAGMAHEINNPLTGVLGMAQILLSDLPAGDPHREMAEEIEAQGLRIQKIVSEMLQVSRSEDREQMVPVDLNALIDEAVAQASGSLAEAGITVERRLTAGLPRVLGNPVRLAKVFDELIGNARRAMPEGGKLQLETVAPDPGAVVARIEDTGQGIRPEHVGKIFDPFFTTKQNWASTGMGLTLVHRIVEQHQGRIAVESSHGHGATFTLTFPADPGRTLLE